MPIIDQDQGIDLVDLADLANNQAAFANFWTGTAGGLKSRVNLRYTDEANRTLLHPANTEGEESYLTASNRKERNDGTAWLSSVVSGHYNFSRAANQTLAASSIALQNVNNVGVALPTAGRFGWESTVFVSGVVASDIKFAYTWPAGATAIWGISGLDTTGVAYTNGSVTASATTVSLGLVGAGAAVMYLITGEIVMGGTAGTLQMQAAQNVADVTAPVLRLVRQRVWREA
jgi:hypothetical protein